jgi:DNA-binding CsgD family transcriptional regulator
MVRRLATLTPQQVRVLMMLSEGLLNKQIAYELGVSEATVKAHVSAILTKLNVDSRTQAVIAASEIADRIRAHHAIHRVGDHFGTAEQPAPATVGCRGLHDVADTEGIDLSGIVEGVGDGFDASGETIHHLLHDPHGQVILGGEVIIDGPGADIGQIRDLRHGGGVDALLRHHRMRGLDQRLQVATLATRISRFRFLSLRHGAVHL